MKQLDTGEYLSVLRSLVAEGHEVGLTVFGGSMSPFLASRRDRVLLHPVDRPLMPGDIVCYQRPSGQFVLHRICRVRPEGLYLAGDAQSVLEGPLPPERVFARVSSAVRNGKTIGPGTFLWEFFARVWPRLLPFRRPIVSLWGTLRHL